MALKNPGELFGTAKKVPTNPTVNVGESVKNIKQEFNAVEKLRKQIDNASNSLTEVVDKNLSFLSNEYSDLLEKFNGKINEYKEEITEITHKVDGLEKNNKHLKTEIQVVEQRQQTINLSVFSRVKKEVLSEVNNILSGNVADNIKRLEEKIELVRESYQQTLNEGLLNEPPSTDNSDPLTPLNQNFATIDDLNKHYQLFLNRIQQQLSTLGGGGAVNIRDLDDVDQTSARVNNKYLKYDSASAKWVGADASGGSGITTENVDAQTLTVAGISTFNNDVKFVGQNSNALWDYSTSDLTLWNNTRLVFGDNEDLQMWHGGTHTFIKNTGGDLRIRGDVIKLAREDSTETYIECNVNNDVKLFFNGNEKFATTLEGVSVTGLTTTTHLAVSGVTTYHGDVNFPGAAYHIHWDQPTSKFKFDDSAQCVWGSASGGDLRIWHASDVSNIKNETGSLKIAGNDIRLQSQNNSEDYILCTDGADVKLFFNDSEKLATTNAGIDVTGSLDVSDSIFVANNIKHLGDNDTYVEFTDDQIRIIAGGKALIHAEESTIDTVIINDGSNDLDFRVEGQNDEQLIFSDGSTDKVGIGSAIPRATLDVVGGELYVGYGQTTGVVLTSPNGTKYRLVVANDGTLSTSAV